MQCMYLCVASEGIVRVVMQDMERWREGCFVVMRPRDGCGKGFRRWFWRVDGSISLSHGATWTWTWCQALLSTPRRFQIGATVSG